MFVFISAFLVAFVAGQDSHSSKASRRRLLLSHSAPAELVAGGLAILLLAASVAWLAIAFQARDAPFVLLALASIAAVLALAFYWLRLRMLRAAVARDLTDLEKSEARLAGIIRSSMEAIISVDDAQRIAEIYRRSGRYDVRVNPEIIEQPNNRVDLVFTIVEGSKTGVRSIECT